jgi:hypothetical protein
MKMRLTAILFTASDADLCKVSLCLTHFLHRSLYLHLDKLLDFRRPLQILLGRLDVVLDGLFGQVQHVGAEKRFALLLEEGLISVHHA